MPNPQRFCTMWCGMALSIYWPRRFCFDSAFVLCCAFAYYRLIIKNRINQTHMKDMGDNFTLTVALTRNLLNMLY